MITIDIPIAAIPSLKNEKTIYLNTATQKPFIATKRKTKSRMQDITTTIWDCLRIGAPHIFIIKSGEYIPLDDSLAWMGFVRNHWLPVNSKKQQCVTMNIQRNYNDNLPQYYDVEIIWRICNCLHRDADNMVSSILDAYLDAVAKLLYMPRNVLRNHATKTIKRMMKKS